MVSESNDLGLVIVMGDFNTHLAGASIVQGVLLQEVILLVV